MIADVYEIKSYDQAKVLSNKIRMRIIQQFCDLTARTSKQMADELGLPASKVHYHIRELVKVGLLTLVDTKEKGGVIEKYYLPIAKEFRMNIIEETPLADGQKSGNYMATRALLNEHRDSFLESLEAAEKRPKAEAEVLRKQSTLVMGMLELTDDEREELRDELREMMSRWQQRTEAKKEGVSPHTILFSMHKTKDVEQEG